MDRELLLWRLERIRTSLIRIFIVIVLVSALSYIFSEKIINFLQKPYGKTLYYYGLPEAFLTNVTVALFGGVFLSMPFILWEVWSSTGSIFIQSYKKYSLIIVGSATILFYTGALICYRIVLPAGIQFLVSYGGSELRPMLSLRKYIVFTTSFILVFGIIFQMPLIMLLLNRIGIVSKQILTKNRRYAILFISIASAILTPTPDVYNMGLMMIPLIVLYELSILLIWVFGKKKEIKI